MLIFSVIIQPVKQGIFIRIPKVKIRKMLIIIHGFQCSSKPRFFLKGILEPLHICRFHIYCTCHRIHWKRPSCHSTEGKIRRKKICDLVFSANDIDFLKKFQYFLLLSGQHTLPRFCWFLDLHNYIQDRSDILLTFIFIQPDIQKLRCICFFCKKCCSPASFIHILKDDPGKLHLYIRR